MRLYKLLPDGRRQILGFALPRDFVGLAASPRHGFSADAIGPVTVCRFSRTSFARFTENRPRLAPHQRVCGSRAEPGARPDGPARTPFRGGKSRDLPDRLARSIGSAWGTHQDGTAADEPPGHCGFPRPETIETVSRTFTKLERDGVIEIMPGNVCLLDPARAEALAAA